MSEQLRVDQEQTRLSRGEREYRWKVIFGLKNALRPLYLLSRASFVILILMLVAFWGLQKLRPNALFLITAETNQLSFEVRDSVVDPGTRTDSGAAANTALGSGAGTDDDNTVAAAPLSFFIRGASVLVENEVVIDKSLQASSTSEEGVAETEINQDDQDDKAAAYCITGWMDLRAGSRVDLRIVDGLQTAWIEGEGMVLSNAGGDLALENAVDVPANPLLLTESDLPADSAAQVLNPGGLLLEGRVQIRADPECAPLAESGDGAPIIFAPRNEPLFVDGPGQVGRQILRRAQSCDPGRPNCANSFALPHALDPANAFITGEIDVLAREMFCWEMLSEQGCSALFRTNADAVPIPAGSSIVGSLTADTHQPTDLVGHVFFDGDVYHLNVSTRANAISMILPHANSTGFTSNELRLTLADRLFTDAWILVVSTIFLTVFGWVLSILQIEMDRVPDDPVALANATLPQEKGGMLPASSEEEYLEESVDVAQHTSGADERS